MTSPQRPDAATITVTPPFHVHRPDTLRTPLLVASPHSGALYPPEFVAASRLDFPTLRRSEDCFVDELVAEAPSLGVPVLAATFPRAYCDVNREPWELDPAMFTDTLPAWCNTSTARVGAGFGTIARLVSSGEPIYPAKIPFEEAEKRITLCWQPYHAALAGMIDEAVAAFARCVLLDIHSMPTEGLRPEPSRHESHFVLGDAFGTSCNPALSVAAHRLLEREGFLVRRNDPYAGGYVTRNYGRPRQGVHVLQVEISRALYMRQRTYEKLDAFAQIRAVVTRLIGELAQLALTL